MSKTNCLQTSYYCNITHSTETLTLLYYYKQHSYNHHLFIV